MNIIPILLDEPPRTTFFFLLSRSLPTVSLCLIFFRCLLDFPRLRLFIS